MNNKAADRTDSVQMDQLVLNRVGRQQNISGTDFYVKFLINDGADVSFEKISVESVQMAFKLAICNIW